MGLKNMHDIHYMRLALEKQAGVGSFMKAPVANTLKKLFFQRAPKVQPVLGQSFGRTRAAVRGAAGGVGRGISEAGSGINLASGMAATGVAASHFFVQRPV